jgi:hypothetical protein
LVRDAVYLVRPDGYVAIVARGPHAVEALQAFGKRAGRREAVAQTLGGRGDTG